MLVSFLAVVLFSFAAMAHGEEGGMQGDCPFSAMGLPLCPQNIDAAVVHHISAYQSFLAVFVGPSITVAIISLLSGLFAAFLLSTGPPLYRSYVFKTRFHSISSPAPRDRKTARWLSLLENSPSVA